VTGALTPSPKIDGSPTAPIVSFYGFLWPTRWVIAQPEGDALWIWSAVTLSDALKSMDGAIGWVRHLVGANKLHHPYDGGPCTANGRL
jgi:hypothetical protein